MEALRRIDSGTATVGGFDVAQDPDAVKRIIGVQFQSVVFFDKVRLEELLKFTLFVYHVQTANQKNYLRGFIY